MATLSKIENYRFAHAAQVRALEELQVRLTSKRRSQHSNFLIGPGRGGKSTTVDELCRRLIDDGAKVVKIDVSAASAGNFNMQTLFVHLAEALGCPLDGKREKVDFLRDRCVQYANHNRVDYIILDDADVIASSSSDSVIKKQADLIKSLANACDSKFLFVGTSPLLQVFSQFGQQFLRSSITFILPYKIEKHLDRKIFAQCVRRFNSVLEIPLEQPLVDSPQFLHERCSGLIGALAGILMDSLDMAMFRNEKVITKARIEAETFPVLCCNDAIEDIRLINKFASLRKVS